MGSDAPMIKIEWSLEDGGFIATDSTRPGCSAWGQTEDRARRELRDAQAAWDEAKANGDRAFVGDPRFD